jgi:hypothetical protein
MSMIPTKSTESEDDSFLPFTADRHVTHWQFIAHLADRQLAKKIFQD